MARKKKNPTKPRARKSPQPAANTTPPADDQAFQQFANELAARVAKNEEARIKQVLTRLRTEIFPRLRKWGVAKLVAEYSGYGDDGCINSLGYLDAHSQPVNMDLVRAASDPEIMAVLYELLPDGFENGEGGQGDLTVDLKSGTVTLEHQENYTETRSTSEQWEV